MDRALFKEIVVSGGGYRVQKMSAMVASRIYNMLISCMLKSSLVKEAAGAGAPESVPVQNEEYARGMVTFLWQEASGALDESVYAKIQEQCLQACRVMDGDKPLPVKMLDGRWAAKELEQDAITVNRLIEEALQFNIAPFFLGSPSSAATTGA